MINNDKDIVFIGDILFECVIGCIDLVGGSGCDLLCFIVDKFLVFDDSMVVLFGYGNFIIIGVEWCFNLFFEGLSW